MMDGTEILGIPSPDDHAFTKFILHYKQLMALYESAIRCVAMRLNIMEKEADTNGKHNPILSSSSRIEQSLSISHKLRNGGMPLTTKSITENLHDVVGVRIICEYLSDVYKIRDNLLADGFMELLQKKDYIKTPKSNGYRSLHLIVTVPVPFQTGLQKAICELQLRTTAMDTWTALEHTACATKRIGPAARRLTVNCWSVPMCFPKQIPKRRGSQSSFGFLNDDSRHQIGCRENATLQTVICSSCSQTPFRRISFYSCAQFRRFSLLAPVRLLKIGKSKVAPKHPSSSQSRSQRETPSEGSGTLPTSKNSDFRHRREPLFWHLYIQMSCCPVAKAYAVRQPSTKILPKILTETSVCNTAYGFNTVHIFHADT